MNRTYVAEPGYEIGARVFLEDNEDSENPAVRDECTHVRLWLLAGKNTKADGEQSAE